MLSTSRCQGLFGKPWEETVLCDTGCTTCDEADAAGVPLLLLNCNQKKKRGGNLTIRMKKTLHGANIPTQQMHTIPSSRRNTLQRRIYLSNDHEPECIPTEGVFLEYLSRASQLQQRLAVALQ